MPIRFFKSSSEFRNWLQQNHETAGELFVGFHRKNSGRPSVIWPEAVDQALCFDRIDGVRKSIDAHSYCIRFTPRTPKSIWSRINVKRVQELSELGLMQAAGLKVFNDRDQNEDQVTRV